MKVASVNNSETRLSQKLALVEEQSRFFQLAADAASERAAMKARVVIENPSDEIRRLQREESVTISNLNCAKVELKSLDTVIVKIGNRQKEHNDAIKFLKNALTHRDRHDVLKNNPVEMPRPIDILTDNTQHDSCSEVWLPNGTKSVLIRTKGNYEKHLFRVDRHNRLLVTNSPCPNGCGFLVTWQGTYCCNGCASGRGCHGQRCERMPIHSQQGAKAKLSKWKADQKKRDKDINAELKLCNENLERASNCMRAASQLGTEALESIPSTVVDRHPGHGNSLRNMNHNVCVSLRGAGCSQVEAIHQQIAAVEQAEGTVSWQVSLVEQLVRLVKDDVERLEQDLMMAQSLAEEESNKIFRRLREQICCSVSSPPPAMNPAYAHSGSLQTTPRSAPAAFPSAPMEEDVFVPTAEISSPFGESRQVESMPPAATVIETCNVPSRGTLPPTHSYSMLPSHVSTIPCASAPAPPEATIIASSSDLAQDTIPMVNATLVQETM